MQKQPTNSWYCFLSMHLFMFTTTFVIGYPQSCLNPILPVIKKLYNETYVSRYGESMSEYTWAALLSLTVSMLVAGGFVGSLSFNTLLKFLTRKQVVITLHIASIAGYVIIAIGAGIWGSYEAFIVGRFVTGLALGLGISVLPVIVNETCIPHRREFYGGVLGVYLASAVVPGVFIAWDKILGTDELWIGVMLFPILYSLLYFVFAYWIDETPYQTLLKHGEDEAAKILKKLRNGDAFQFEKEMKSLTGKSVDNISADTDTEHVVATFSEIYRTPQYRRHFVGCVILFSSIMLSGVNNIFFFSDQIFLRAGLDPAIVTPATLGVFILGPIFSIFGVFLLKCVEPRHLLLGGTSVMIIGDILMTTSLATYKTIPGMSIGSIAAMCIFYSGYIIVNSVVFVMIGLISIDKTRPLCTNIGGASLWLCSWFVVFFATFLEIWIGPYAFMVWMGSKILLFFYIIFFLPNTKRKTSEEVQDYFKNN